MILPKNLSGIGRHRSASAEHYLIVGKRRELLLLNSNSVASSFNLSGGQGPPHCVDLTLIDCVDTTIYALTSFRNVKILHCKNCVIIAPAVAASVLVHFSRNLAVHIASVSSL